MDPSSNLQQSTDAAWLYLLGGHRQVVCLGEPPLEIMSALRDLVENVTVVDHGETSGVSDIDALIVVSTDDDWVYRVFETVQPELVPEAAIIQLPGSVSVSARPGWIVFRTGVTSFFGHRLGLLRRLVGAKVAALFGMSISDRSRRHASDVPFVLVPDHEVSRRNEASVSVQLGAPSLPRYLIDLGTAHGVTFATSRWLFGPPRGFASQKVVFQLDRTNEAPPTIVKLTQAARFNERLRAEANAIRSLADVPGIEFVIPTMIFETTYADRLVVCQTKIDGVPFRQLATRDPGDEAATAGFQAAINLSAVTVTQAVLGDCGTAMRRLADDLIELYQPPPDVVSGLAQTVARLSRIDLPTVFMHGDFGVWNLLLDSGHRVGVLDWENADPEGVPLWDLFVFARTLGVFLADVSGIRYTSAVFSQQLLAASPLREALFDHIRQYRTVVDIPSDAVDDLFVMCWVQQAVREAASLASPTWLNSRSTQLLHCSLEKPLGFRS